ncbi:50S ribosomal protein L20 [candidate division KSB1 bacterium]|nr:MAG: 50S ribosomal protein L20 [candidate division KSB1 bacterium]
MRVKGGFVTRRRHNKILRSTRGQHSGRHRIFSAANQAMMKAGVYQYRDRRNRKRDFRRLWIQRINAGAREHGLSYSRLMHGLKVAGVELNRKLMADMAVNDPAAFARLVQTAQQAVGS